MQLVDQNVRPSYTFRHFPHFRRHFPRSRRGLGAASARSRRGLGAVSAALEEVGIVSAARAHEQVVCVKFHLSTTTAPLTSTPGSAPVSWWYPFAICSSAPGAPQSTGSVIEPNGVSE